MALQVIPTVVTMGDASKAQPRHNASQSERLVRMLVVRRTKATWATSPAPSRKAKNGLANNMIAEANANHTQGMRHATVEWSGLDCWKKIRPAGSTAAKDSMAAVPYHLSAPLKSAASLCCARPFPSTDACPVQTRWAFS